MVVSTSIASPAPHLELTYFELSYAKANSGDDFTKKYAQHRINFGELASNFGAAGYGFGVERVDFARNSRKTVQQTKGRLIEGQLVPGSNFFVDVWWASPPKITLAGVAEMPAAKDLPVCYWNENNVDNIQRKLFSFLDALDIMFEFNTNPEKIKNDELWLFDYKRKQQLQVTLKDFTTNVSIERPNLIIFQINMEVLHEIHTDFSVPYQNQTNATTNLTVGNVTLPPLSESLNKTLTASKTLGSGGSTESDKYKLQY
jgi:hypothetical protein